VSEMVNREVVRGIFDLERTLLRPKGGCKAPQMYVKQKGKLVSDALNFDGVT
jgi:hypothetical protein